MSLLIKELLRDKRVILASGSPRRKELMGLIAENFEIMIPRGEEKAPQGTPAEQIPQLLARQKCAEIVSECAPNLNTVVIACDTLVISPDGEPMGKPADDRGALDMLRTLCGRQHKVVSGVCVYFDGKYHGFSQSTSVLFRDASDNELEAYVKSGEPQGKAGAYAVQGQGGLLVERIEGDHNNVIGLPAALLAVKLAKMIGERDED